MIYNWKYLFNRYVEMRWVKNPSNQNPSYVPSGLKMFSPYSTPAGYILGRPGLPATLCPLKAQDWCSIFPYLQQSNIQETITELKETLHGILKISRWILVVIKDTFRKFHVK